MGESVIWCIRFGYQKMELLFAAVARVVLFVTVVTKPLFVAGLQLGGGESFNEGCGFWWVLGWVWRGG